MVTAETASIADHVEQREGNLAGVDKSMCISNNNQSKSNASDFKHPVFSMQADTLNNGMASE